MTGVTERVSRLTWVRGTLTRDTDTLVEETPVALVYNGLSHVVMMATPSELEDLALAELRDRGGQQPRHLAL